MGEVIGRVAGEEPAELEDRRGAGTGAADVVGGEAGDDVDRGVVGAGDAEDAGRAAEVGAVVDGAAEDGAVEDGAVEEGAEGAAAGEEADAADDDGAPALPGAVAAGWRTEPAGVVEAD